MARAKKTEAAAPEAVQEGQEPQELTQDAQEVEAVSVAPEGAQDSAAQEIIGPGAEAELLGSQEEAPLEEEPILATYAVTGCERLNLRERPGLDARVLAALPRGVGVLGEDGPAQDGWRWVATGRLEGWVMADYLELLGLGMALGDG